MAAPPKLTIAYRATGELCGSPRNARTHSKKQVAQIAASIKTFGFNNPILVDEIDDGFTMFVGADQAANLLEVGVIDTSDAPIMSTPCPLDRRI